MKSALRSVLRHDTHPAIQFIKYGVAGVLATAVDFGTFYLLALTVIPAVQPDDRLIVLLGQAYDLLAAHAPGLADWGWLQHLMQIEVQPIEEAVRSRNFVIVRCINFVLSNIVAYTLNVLFVFKPGRHDRHLEVALFLTVSVISFLLGTGLGWVLIRFFHVGTTEAYVANIVAAVLINYVCRKYFVFKG
jgi:putative flippase GtrA